MIYDCFPFFNELDLLEIRVQELSDVVDRFVIVESRRTHQNMPKPLYFLQNRERFSAFSDKIIHLISKNLPPWPLFAARHLRRPTPRDREAQQRNWIARGLLHCDPHDTILISDVDEIPSPKRIVEFKNVTGIKVFRQNVFNYFLNCMNMTVSKTWRGTVMLDYQSLTSPQDIRQAAHRKSGPQREDLVFVEDGGWHFSFLGDTTAMIEKIEAFSHDELNVDRFKNSAALADAVRSRKDLFGRDYEYRIVPIDASFPRAIRENRGHYNHLITH
jgi:beta-1,4-mannosyl-glycoprotein beta-1,4-N-acetylglucosaminyltransferase